MMYIVPGYEMSYIKTFCSYRPALGCTIGSLELQEIQTQGNSLSLTAWLTYTLTATSPSLDSRSSVIAVPIVSVSVFLFLICACLYCFGVALTRDAKTGSCRIASVPCAMFELPSSTTYSRFCSPHDFLCWAACRWPRPAMPHVEGVLAGVAAQLLSSGKSKGGRE